VPDIKEILDRKTSLIGTRVFTETGDAQGSVNDIYFDEASGRVLSLEVTGGMWRDATTGVRNLPVTEVMRTGPEIIYVHPDTADLLAAQRGGISGAVADAGDASRAAAADAAATLAPEDQLVGKRTAEDVENDRGAVIVPAGHRVSEEDVERARQAGRLPELVKAVGLAQASNGAGDIADSLSAAGDRASGLWDQFTQRIGLASDAAGRRVDEAQTKDRLKKIEDAVGRPVTKAILDLHDAVILDVGDLVTHAAVQRAHDAGSLDSLLDSVYRADVSFDKEELRARRPGEAALDQAAGTGAPIVEEMRSSVRQAAEERDAGAERAKAADDDARREREQARDRRAREREAAVAARAPDDPETERGVGPTTGAAPAEPADAEAQTTRMKAVGPGKPAGVKR
jgi:sporulation protein YlmC with PRC-barrel domain